MFSIHMDPRHPGVTINKNLYGQFSEHLGRCIYGGIYVGEDSPIPNVNGMRTDVVEALKKLEVPVLRWPGGCFADEYHWRDGIGPKEGRKRMVNTHWGGVVEDNSFGTHEFMELCRQIGCEPYINGNVGSGSIREMSEWVEYLNSAGDSTVVKERWANGHHDPFNVRYFCVGNENWGCGGNMRPEFYADLYRRFQTYCRNYGENKLFRIACGPSGMDTNWTEVLMREAGHLMDALSLHHYTVPGPWEHKGSATGFDTDLYYLTLEKANSMEAVVSAHLAIMDRYDPEHKVSLIVDEWGDWFDVEPGTNPGFLYQQNTMRDAMVAALTLNIFNSHADRIAMTNIAQMVNVLQAMVLTDGDRMILTPTYHVYDLYKPHMNASLVETAVFCDRLENGMKQLTASASVKDGVLTLTVANLSADQAAEVLLDAGGCGLAAARTLAGKPQDYNEFDGRENAVHPVALEGWKQTEQGTVVTLPPCSVTAFTFRG